MLESGKKVFNQVPLLIKLRVIRAGIFAVAAGRNNNVLAGPFERLDHPFIGIVGFISDDGLSLDIGEQNIRAIEIAGLSRRQKEARRIAQGVDRGVDFCA